MPDLWLPGFERRTIGQPIGGTYDEVRNPKMGWHTWEGYGWAGFESVVVRYPPHLAVNPKDRIRREYVPLNRHSYAFAGSESDDEFIIQIEVAGRAGETHLWPDADYEWLGNEVVVPIEDALQREYGVTIPRVALRFYGNDAGFTLASKTSRIRLTADQLRAYTGHLGHQHMPSPDSHWDPGKFAADRMFAAIDPHPPEELTMAQIDDILAALEVLQADVATIKGATKPSGQNLTGMVKELHGQFATGSYSDPLSPKSRTKRLLESTDPEPVE